MAVTLKVAVCPCVADAFCGCWVIMGGAGGFSVTVAVANLVESAALVAVTVTVCKLVMVAGAVYKPPEVMEPPLAVTVQETAWLLVPFTVAVNCCVCKANRLAVAGATVTEPQHCRPSRLVRTRARS